MTNPTSAKNETKITKADQVKIAIMETLNTQESATREELHTACSKISSARTITRALASLKLDGRIQQMKDGNNFSWISNESPKKEKAKTADEIQDDKFIKDLKADEKPAATDQGKEFLKDQGLTIVETKTDKTAGTSIPAQNAKTEELGILAAKYDNEKIIATGTEFYATGIEKAGKWTSRDLFLMDSLNINYTMDAKDDKKDKKKTKADKDTTGKKNTGSKKDDKAEKKNDPAKANAKKADKADPAKKKTITKDNLIDAGKAGVKRNPAAPKTTPPAKDAKVSQTSIIRDGIKAKKTAEKILAEMVETFGKDLKWAKARFATYEKAYGKMGITDPKLKK